MLKSEGKVKCSLGWKLGLKPEHGNMGMWLWLEAEKSWGPGQGGRADETRGTGT